MAAPTSDHFRPRYHFTARRNWLNDPNGLVWHAGEWHLFYQYNPHGDRWGHMSWGHAVSRDLVRWEELPVAIPEDDQHMIFSGSAVIDAHGVAGHGKDAMIALYTGAGRGEDATQVQCLAASTDRGRSFAKDPANPVLDLGLKDFRDPKVFWHGPTARWVMATVRSTENRAELFASRDLRQWDHLSFVGPFDAPGELWECPDLIELPVEGGGTGWLFKVDLIRCTDRPGSGTLVIAGDFDGATFTPEADGAGRPILGWADRGSDFYAAISWDNTPRRVWIGWMNCHDYAAITPTAPWRGAMTVPRSLSLRRIDGALRLVQQPVEALEALRGRAVPIEGQAWQWPSRHFEVDLAVSLSTAPCRLRLEDAKGQAVTIAYDPKAQALVVDRSGAGPLTDNPVYAAPMIAPLSPAKGVLGLRILADSCSLEIFADDGATVLTLQHFLAEGPCSLSIEGGEVVRAEGWEMRSA